MRDVLHVIDRRNRSIELVLEPCRVQGEGAADHQTIISMSQRRARAARRQPEPVNQWNCKMLSSPEAVFGKWLAPNANNAVRLNATPLLIGKNKTIYAAYCSVRSSWSPPVIVRRPMSATAASLRLAQKKKKTQRELLHLQLFCGVSES